MRTPAKVKVSIIRKFFEDKIVKPKYKTRGKTRSARTARSGRKINFSTSSSEEEMNSPKEKRSTGKTATATGQATGQKHDKKDKDKDAMETDSTRKRPRDEQQIAGNPDKIPKDTATEEEIDATKDRIIDLSEIQIILEKGGAGHLFEAVKGKVMELLDKVLLKQARVMKQFIEETRKRDKEYDRCGKSILIHNADKLVVEEYDDRVNYSLAEKVTEALHTMCRCMITIVEAFPMGRMIEGKPTTSICVVLGSNRQKSVVYRTIAGHVKHKTTIGQAIQQVTLRDVFPKHLIPESQRLVQVGEIHSFKVSAVGLGVIPVLFVRYKDGYGNLGQWKVYQQTPAWNQSGDGQQGGAQTEEGGWQVVLRGRQQEGTSQATGAAGREETERPAFRGLLTDPYLAGIDPDLQDAFIRRGMQKTQQKKK